MGCCKTIQSFATQWSSPTAHAAERRKARSGPRTHVKEVCRIHSGKPSGKVPRSWTEMSEAPGVWGNFCGFSAKVGKGTAVPALNLRSPSNSHWMQLPKEQGRSRREKQFPPWMRIKHDIVEIYLPCALFNHCFYNYAQTVCLSIIVNIEHPWTE